jgi:hypothetical protein
MKAVPEATTLRDRLIAFVAERHPFAATAAIAAFDKVAKRAPVSADALDRLRAPFRKAFVAAIDRPKGLTHLEATPGVSVPARFDQAIDEAAAACDGFLAREAIVLGLTDVERREILAGMILTRALDTRLKAFFTGSDVRYGATPFQGKGFRSLGQEAIYAAAIRLRRGPAWQGDDGAWNGDVIGPIIRDLGAALAMHPESSTIRMVLSAQMAKAGPPMNGRDLHIGDFAHGILPAAAPLAISSLTVAGMGLAFAQARAERVAVSFIGEGGSSLGEWQRGACP